VTALVLAIGVGQAAPRLKPACRRVTIEGEVSAGREWKADVGQGWVFRVVPIAASQPEYSGWDLVMDREPPAGYPDALLLATPPFNSINEREIGTTFGLRAQDAIGWNPRSFRFLSSPDRFPEGQRLFRQLAEVGFGAGTTRKTDGSNAPGKDAMGGLLALQKGGSRGEFRILDARIVPGIADPQPYAQGWALAGSRTQHEIEAAPAGQASARGRLLWMRFALTLWLPARWNVAAELDAASVPCPPY
jgi:hypothetical protein